MKKAIFLIPLFLLFLILTNCDSSNKESESIVGTWKSGTLTMTLNSNNTFASVDPVNSISVTGTYVISGNQFTITDIGGPSVCPVGQTTGTYTYTIAPGGATLTLVKISDSCTNRTTALNGQIFTRQ
jgi:hypothetical protein